MTFVPGKIDVMMPQEQETISVILDYVIICHNKCGAEFKFVFVLAIWYIYGVISLNFI